MPDISAAVAAGNSTTAVTSASGISSSPRASSGLAAFDAMESSVPNDSQISKELSIDDISDEGVAEPIAAILNDDRKDFAIDVAAEYAAKHPDAAKAAESVQLETPEAQLPATRDYTQFTTEDAVLLKKMPNHVFASVAQRFAQVKQGIEYIQKLEARVKEIESGAMPESYLQHPQAYTLSPEYSEHNDIVQQAQFESNLLERAINAIDQGRPYQRLTGYNNQGKPILSTVEPQIDPQGNVLVDTATKNRLVRELSRTEMRSDTAQQSLSKLRNTFTQQHSQRSNELQSLQSQLFPILDKPENSSYIEAEVRNLPSYLRADPAVAGFIARGALLVTALRAANKELQSKITAQTTIAADRAAAGPSPSALSAANGGSRVNDKNMLNISDWEND